MRTHPFLVSHEIHYQSVKKELITSRSSRKLSPISPITVGDRSILRRNQPVPRTDAETHRIMLFIQTRQPYRHPVYGSISISVSVSHNRSSDVHSWPVGSHQKVHPEKVHPPTSDTQLARWLRRNVRRLRSHVK